MIIEYPTLHVVLKEYSNDMKVLHQVKSGSTKNISDENWALLLEEECDHAQVAAEDPAGRFGGTFTCSMESLVSLKSD